MTPVLERLRRDALDIARAGVAAADPYRATAAALARPDVGVALGRATALRVVAVGKAAVPMWQALRASRWASSLGGSPACVMSAPQPVDTTEPGVQAYRGGHPLPTGASADAALAALRLAEATGAGELLVVLISGGASALLALPDPPLTLDDKVRTTAVLLRSGATIAELNAVRKHLSAIKGGRLARAARGRCVTLALSDVIGASEDDLSVIGSGPAMPDPSTYADALAVIEGYGLRSHVPPVVLDVLAAGVRGERPESPKPFEADMGDVRGWVVGSRHDAMRGADARARALGYVTHVRREPIVGEAREQARALVASLANEPATGPRCVIASGETTVTVRGQGRGGRNQEFALAAAWLLADHARPMALCSLGTDGIDGPTDAAGGLVDTSTRARAEAAGLAIPALLADNDSYGALARLGDLVVTGPTGTNVGDLVVVTLA